MASSCIPAGLRLDLEMVKGAAAAAAGAAPPRPTHSAAPSSALSEASNASSSATSSVASLSLKRARTPRKRPNQTYNEAAALLASMYPSVFPVAKGVETAPPRLLGLASALADDPSYSDLLPPFPVLGHAAFLLRNLTQPAPPPILRSPVPAKSCTSPASSSSAFSEFRDLAPSPATPDTAGGDESDGLDFDDDDSFDADSILGVDEAAAAGIDDIMGKLAVDSEVPTTANVTNGLRSSSIHPCLRSLMMLGLQSRHDRHSTNPVLKGRNVDTQMDWWMCPAIPLKDITPSPPASVATAMLAASEKKKSKKKGVGMKKNVAVGQCKKDEPANGDTGALALPETGLGLRLNTEEVLKAWCGRGCMFSDGSTSDLPLSSSDVAAKHADADLFPENGASGVIREGNALKMQRKKQCTPLLSNKSRYYRPRVKGRFVSKAFLLQQSSEKGELEKEIKKLHP